MNRAMKNLQETMSVWFVAELQTQRTLHIITDFQILLGLEFNDRLRLLFPAHEKMQLMASYCLDGILTNREMYDKERTAISGGR